MSTHLRCYGTIKFDICTTMNTTDLEMRITDFFRGINDEIRIEGTISDIEFDKVSLCDDDCFDKYVEVEGDF